MGNESISINGIEERVRKIDKALKGLVLYRQLRHQPDIRAFEDFIHGLVSDSVSAGQLWDDYNRFLHYMISALEESRIVRYDVPSSLNDTEHLVDAFARSGGGALGHEDSSFGDAGKDLPGVCGLYGAETGGCGDDAPCMDCGIKEGIGGVHNGDARSGASTAGYDLWKAYWGYQILTHETAFSRYAEHAGFEGLPEWLKVGMAFELENLREIALLDWEQLLILARHKGGIDRWLNIFSHSGAGASEREAGIPAGPSALWGGINKPVPYYRVINWGVRELACHFHYNGSGMFGIFKGFRWERVDGRGCLRGVTAIDSVTLDQLVGYEEQKARLIENTEQLLMGYRANNVLLYGDKGTGKSSLVKALVHRYAERGLRIVEVTKECLKDYYLILELLEGRKQKFILFVDDLSFEEGEVEYKHIKALLEGGLKVRPANVVVYATSNRRHLVKEFHSERSGAYAGQEDEVSPMDSMQEKLSLSDRFGITLTFMAPNQRTYLEMVERLAAGRGVSMDADALREEALRWEKRYNGRSGRTARQFVDYLEARLGSGSVAREASSGYADKTE